MHDDAESRARYRCAVTTWRTEVQPQILKRAWKAYVAELVERGSLTPDEVTLPRWRSPNVGRLRGEPDD